MTERAMRWALQRAAFAALLAGCALFCQGSPARAAPTPGLCATAATDDTLRPIPDALVPATVKLFGLAAMPPEQVKHSTFFRCFAGEIMLCTTGANLPCGKANDRRNLPAATAWCEQHANAESIPAYVTGHDTIYSWRCDGRKAAIAAERLQLDPRGFIAQFWKAADPISRH